MSVLAVDDVAVHGLVDNRRAAALLGVSVNVFRVWAHRSKTATGGIAAAMPEPVATMHGNVYRVEDIEAFGRQIALMARAPRTTARANGRYFTPHTATELMVEWAIRDERDVLLEPSVGDGQFAVAAQRFAASRGWRELDIHACEIDAETARRAASGGAVRPDRLHVGDFLGPTALPMVDVVIGNPPYVRVRELGSTACRNALGTAAAVIGTPMDNSGSAWMPFVAKATSQLKQGGRLALVLPLDFTYVRYARPLWGFLSRSFAKLRVVRVRERIFPDILQNVLILLAEGKGGQTDSVEQVASERVDGLQASLGGRGVEVPIVEVTAGERSFQRALLSTQTREALAQLEPHSVLAGAQVKFSIGYVSGNKSFFQPTLERIAKYRLPKRSLKPAVDTSRQLARVGLGTSTAEAPSALWLPGTKLTRGEQLYVAAGEEEGVDMAYKCRIRNPWYRVPGVRAPDLLLTAFSDRPRLHLNDGRWVASNSVLCGFVRPGESAKSIVSAWYTPLTLLSTEMQIHALGGGVMVAVPREADSVRILKTSSARAANTKIINTALLSGDTTTAYCAGAKAIERIIGATGVQAILEGTDLLTRWRKAQS